MTRTLYTEADQSRPDQSRHFPTQPTRDAPCVFWVSFLEKVVHLLRRERLADPAQARPQLIGADKLPSTVPLDSLQGFVDVRAVTRRDVGARFGQVLAGACLLYTSPSPRDKRQSRMPSSA